MRGLIRDVAIVIGLSVILALGYNSVRKTGSIPIIAKEPYRILIPCPEPGGEVIEIAADKVKWTYNKELIVDARDVNDREWVPEAPGLVSIPFDFLEPVEKDLLADLLSRRVERVVVFGDGQEPDSGKELASEISGSGVKNVHFVKGGIEAIKAYFGGEQ